MARRLRTLVLVAACALGIVGLAPLAASAATPHDTLAPGHLLTAGHALVSRDHRYSARVTPSGRLAVYRGSTLIWKTRVTSAHATLTMHLSGDLTVGTHTAFWSSVTSGAGRSVLTLGNDGALEIRNSGGLVWSSRVGNRCSGTGQRVTVDLSSQSAVLCSGRDQVLTTPITSGASAIGDATPTGTWRLQAKIRHTTLYPAGGGAYPVDFWMPYDGAYGMHDSPWQTFAYGSSLYRTRGSHGCVHFPHAAIAWMFSWARVGSTVVSIHQ